MNRRSPRVAVAALILAALGGFVVCRMVFRPRPPSPPHDAAADRDAAKRRAALALIDGRMTLMQAAAAFRDADAEDPLRTREVAASLGGGSVDVGYCRSVIEWVRQEAPPGRAEDLARPLEAELGRRLRDGTLHIPPQSAAAAADGARAPASRPVAVADAE